MNRTLRASLAALLIIVLLLLAGYFAYSRLFGVYPRPSGSKQPFFASIDTMKESRDTETHPISQAEIARIVQLSASLNTNYITVDTHWNYPGYMKKWIDAIRASGRYVWFRTQPNEWEDDNGSTGIMTPQQYEAAERQFILAHPSFFQPGDIFDPCSEPENGLYWKAHYGDTWADHAPNAATQAYNAFLLATTNVANAALHQDGISSVITTVHSTNSFFASSPSILESKTVHQFGYITVDSYPEGNTTNPAAAAQARIDELNRIENLWHVPIIIGEMGYSNSVPVGDATQQAVLQAELDAIEKLPYVAGLNYWVGAGTNNSGGYTHIFTKTPEGWALRPAAHNLAAFFKEKS
jgi:hypothetical protein